MYDLRSDDGPATERPELPRRLREEPEEEHHTGRWVALGVLALAIAGFCWWGYPTLKQTPAMLAQFPAVQKSLEGVNAQLAQTESRFKTWGDNQQQLQEHVAQVERAMASRIRVVRDQARDLSDRVYQRVHAEVAAQTQATENKIARLESANEADHANVEKLQTELATLREETARQADQLQSVRSEMERDGANRDQQLVTLNDQVGRDSRDLDGLNKKLAVKRVDFEVTRHHSQQLTEDVSLGVTGTDVSHRRVSGWMWVMPDRRTIWLRGQGAQQPVVFYGTQDGKRRELVITNVAENSVSGYLILPADGSSNGSASLSKGD
jgi:hypothetical protein